MSRRNEPDGCGKIVGAVLLAIVIGLLAPYILEVLWFILFLIIAVILQSCHHF